MAMVLDGAVQPTLKALEAGLIASPFGRFPGYLPWTWSRLFLLARRWQAVVEMAAFDPGREVCPKDYRVFTEPDWAEKWYEARRRQAEG
jgi:hypothetical protein